MDIESLLTLCSVPGIGPRRILNLVARFHEPRSVLQASIEQLCRVDGVDVKVASRIKTDPDAVFAREQLKSANRLGIQFLTFWDDKYPSSLKHIYDPPVLLYVRGDLTCLDAPLLAVVGTRNPTAYGKLVTETLCSEIAAKGITIVSGLARGIDTIAHRAALKAGGKTIAVLGSGLDVIYPPENRSLARKITQSGCLMSELPLGSQPDAPNFPRRNRIIAGLTVGTLIVEAGERSGALITAQLALEQNREVFAVPGNITSEKSRGTNRLIKQGAKPVENADDIIDELRPQLPSLLRMAEAKAPTPELDGSEKLVYQALSNDPKHIDDIAASVGLATGQTLAVLLSLELKNLAVQMTGKYFLRR